MTAPATRRVASEVRTRHLGAARETLEIEKPAENTAGFSHAVACEHGGPGREERSIDARQLQEPPIAQQAIRKPFYSRADFELSARATANTTPQATT